MIGKIGSERRLRLLFNVPMVVTLKLLVVAAICIVEQHLLNGNGSDAIWARHQGYTKHNQEAHCLIVQQFP